jgi:hypothetical protein
MIVIHFAKVSTLYPQVVISTLSERLENLPFVILYTSFSVWPRDHYMSLQRSTIGVCHALLQFPTKAPLVVLRFPNKVPSCNIWIPGEILCQSPLTRARHTSIVFLISRQVILYMTRDDSYCPVVSTPKIRSLAD